MRGFGNIPGGRSMVKKTGRRGSRMSRGAYRSKPVEMTPDDLSRELFAALIIVVCCVLAVMFS